MSVIRSLRVCLLAAFCAFLLTSCETVEGTGRGHLILTSPAEENKMGEDAYKDVLSKEKRCTDPAAIALVERVGKRLAAAAPDKGFKYEFVVLESPTVNAFCLPGGKVAVYTGILPYCQNEAALACVLGHEIGHAIARHGGERMSQGMVVGGLSNGLDAVLKEQGVSATTEKISMTAFGLGAQVGVMLPYSRQHELEADYLGLTYMAKAGYDPQEAPKFWERFSALGSGGPGFLSTHPASDDRAKQLAAKLKEATKLYEASPKYGSGELVPEKYRAAPAAPAKPVEPVEPPKETKKKKKK
jgi:predicted Zn-dependent protease